MSAEPALTPEETPVTMETLERAKSYWESDDTDETSRQPVQQETPTDEPLNAEEATILVVSFLQRLNKKVITPRKAAPSDDVFIVEVELQDGTAIVNINAESWEIVEYTITPKEPREMSLPIEPRQVLRILGGAVLVIINVMMFTFFRAYTAEILNILSNIDRMYFIIGGIVLGIAGIVYWYFYR